MIIHEQTLIAQFAPGEAVEALPDLPTVRDEPVIGSEVAPTHPTG